MCSHQKMPVVMRAASWQLPVGQSSAACCSVCCVSISLHFNYLGRIITTFDSVSKHVATMLTADMQASCSYSSTVHGATESIASYSHVLSRRQLQSQSMSCKLSSTRQRKDRARTLLCRANSEGSSEAARWLRQLESGQKIGSEYGEVRTTSVTTATLS